MNSTRLRKNCFIRTLILTWLFTACSLHSVYAAQLSPPTLIRAEYEEKTASGEPLCNRAIIYWSNPSQSAVSSYRIFINGQDANDHVYFLANYRMGITLYDASAQTVQFASEDSSGEVGPLSNALSVTTPPCLPAKEYKLAILMATMADFAGAPMPDNQPWTLDVVKNRYGVFNNGIGGHFSIADWLSRMSYGKVKVTVDFFDEVILPGTMAQYCNRTLPNYGTVLGYDCNTYRINQDAIAANGGSSQFAKYNVVAVLAKGMGTVGISGITLSAHGAHYMTYHPAGTPQYAPLLHEFLHSYNLTHNAGFRGGCVYPADIFDITKNCDWDRYGGSSIMGIGTMSPNAEELRRLGLLEKNQTIRVTPQTGSTTITIEPLNLKSRGVKQIQVQGTGSHWFPNTYLSIDYRRFTGINYRPGEADSIFFNLRADLQNNGNRDAFTYQVGYRLVKGKTVADFPEWGFKVRLKKMKAASSEIAIEYY